MQSTVVDIIEFENDPGLIIVTSRDEFMKARVGYGYLEVVVMPGAQAEGFDACALTLGRLFNVRSEEGFLDVTLEQLKAKYLQIPYEERPAAEAIMEDMNFTGQQGWDNSTYLQITKPNGYAEVDDAGTYRLHRDHSAAYSLEYIQRSYNKNPTKRVRVSDVHVVDYQYFELKEDAVTQSFGHQGLRRFAVLTKQNDNLPSPIHQAMNFSSGYYLFLNSAYCP